jgi:ubiquinone/menaquinone biosynthesis C-methylase UbiE
MNVTRTGIEWQKTVENEHAQSDRARKTVASADFWGPVAHRFVPVKKGESAPDDTVERLAEMISPEDTVLDVGAGAGRLAVPIADHCAHVTAVEPSEAMRERMASTVEAWQVGNVDIVASRWEEADVDPHNLVVCAHVVYTVTEIESFIRKLSKHARKKVALISFERPATATYHPLWSHVHDEQRIELPSLAQIEKLLSEMSINFEKTMLQEWISRSFGSREQALAECEARLFVEPGSEKSRRLSTVLDEDLVEVEGGFRLQWAEPHRPLIISWNI